MIDEKCEAKNHQTKKIETVGVHLGRQPLSVNASQPLPFQFINMSHRGYIKLWRKFEDWYGSDNPNRLALWVWLLSLATHKPQSKLFQKGIITIKEGQFLTGRKFLSMKTGISESYIESLLKEFEKQGMLRQQKTTKNRLITILNWNIYQSYDNAEDNGATTKRQQKDTNKNGRMEECKKEDSNALRLDCENFVSSLNNNPAYKGIDIKRELAKMDAWLLARPGRQKTQRFIINWLNKVEVVEKKPEPRPAYDRPVDSKPVTLEPETPEQAENRKKFFNMSRQLAEKKGAE